jgi:hypothetical protein
MMVTRKTELRQSIKAGQRVQFTQKPSDKDYEFEPDPFEGALIRPATARVIDFVEALRQPKQNKMRPTPPSIQKFIDERPTNAADLLLTQKRIRARQRRAVRRGESLPPEETALVWKPVEEWDFEEVARGRPRAANGTFAGRPAHTMSREIHERAMERFKALVRTNMNVSTIDAVSVINQILTNEDTDDKGKPVVPAGTKLDAAKFLLEHVVGKAVQPTTSDISIKLQGILGMAMVNPVVDSPGEYEAGHIGTRGELTTGDDDVLDADFWEEDDDG